MTLSDTPLVIYHANCWDGFCAAWVARKALGAIEAVPAQYGQPPPEVADRVVYVLDFSYPRDVMADLATRARRTRRARPSQDREGRARRPPSAGERFGFRKPPGHRGRWWT